MIPAPDELRQPLGILLLEEMLDVKPALVLTQHHQTRNNASQTPWERFCGLSNSEDPLDHLHTIQLGVDYIKS